MRVADAGNSHTDALFDVGLGRGPFADQVLSPKWLLEGDFELHEADLAADEAMACFRFIARARARIEHDLGRGLLLFGPGARFDHGDLGHSHFDDFCSNRLGFSGAQGRELRSLVTHLETLPRLRASFFAGLLSRSKLRPIFRVATPDDEGGWAQIGRQRGTRDLEQLVADVRAGRRGAPAASDDDAVLGEEEIEIPVTWRTSAIERSMWNRHGLPMLRTILGQKGPIWQLAEALAADTLLRLEADPPAPASLSSFVRLRVREAEIRSGVSKRTKRARGRQRAPSAAALAKLARKLVRGLGKTLGDVRGPLPADFTACADEWAALAELQRLARERDALDCDRASLLEACQRRSLHRVLDFRTFDAFVEQGLGLAPRDAFKGTALAKRLAFLPEIAKAWRAGRVSQSDAEQLVEVADVSTESEWLRYAEGLTRKQLGESISWAVAEDARRLSDSEPRLSAIQPPWHLTPSALRANWIEQLGSREQRRRHRERLAAAGMEVRADLEPHDDPQLDAIATTCGLGAHVTRSRTGFSAPKGVAMMWWAAIEAVRSRVTIPLTDAECVHVMLALFLQAHLTPEVERHMRAHRALTRDGHRCTTPGCTAIVSLEEHHLWFKSQGGPDALWNLGATCRGCHALIHRGAISAQGRAPDNITWTIGRGEVRETWVNERLVRAPAPEVSG